MNASTNLYEVLGIDKSADDNDIRKQYKKLCLIHHPDKGGNNETFQKIQKAYEILSNNDKRSMYDQTGMTDEQPQNSGDGIDISSMFANMFGGGFNPFGMNSGPQRKRHKPHPKMHEISVSLKDFYYGKTIKIQFEQQKFCIGCKGEGYTSFSSCGSCNGRGFIEQMVMLGPGMFASTKSHCELCDGAGKKGSGLCNKCKGKKMLNREKVLDVNIEPGMKPGDVLVFPNECSDDINYNEPGDVHIILQEADENINITRKENDLYATCNISFTESILGYTYILKNHPKYPNGFKIEIPKGIQNNEIMLIINEGMPKRNSKHIGSIHLKIEINISQKEKEVLKNNEELFRSLFN